MLYMVWSRCNDAAAQHNQTKIVEFGICPVLLSLLGLSWVYPGQFQIMNVHKILITEANISSTIEPKNAYNVNEISTYTQIVWILIFL